MSSQWNEEAEEHLHLADEERRARCPASREAVVEHGDTACPLCEMPASAHPSEEDR